MHYVHMPHGSAHVTREISLARHRYEAMVDHDDRAEKNLGIAPLPAAAWIGIGIRLHTASRLLEGDHARALSARADVAHARAFRLLLQQNSRRRQAIPVFGVAL